MKRVAPIGNFDQLLSARIGEARNSHAYQAYLDMRDRVLEMLVAADASADMPSKYWQEEIEGFDYLFDASPLIVAKLREHCYHITGIKSYEYRHHHAHAAPAFAAKLQALKARDPRCLFVPEAPALGGFGHDIDGALVNIDTLKFYESLIAMERAGLLAQLRLNRSVVVEIGGGWGGFAYQLKMAVPETTYVIVDLPATLLFSGTYLRTLFPKARFFIYGSEPPERLQSRLKDYDFVLLPHYAFTKVRLQQIDVGINMVSFQEMTTAQVTSYLTRLVELGCPAFYSHNRDRSKHNTELSAVSALLEQHYDLEEIAVLSVPYTNLNAPRKKAVGRGQGMRNRLRALYRALRKDAGHLAAIARGQPPSLLDYRHLVGRRPDARVFDREANGTKTVVTGR